MLALNKEGGGRWTRASGPGGARGTAAVAARDVCRGCRVCNEGPLGGGERSMGRGHWQERGDEGKREKGGEREEWSYALRPLRQAFHDAP